jgi:hypothetical protein
VSEKLIDGSYGCPPLCRIDVQALFSRSVSEGVKPFPCLHFGSVWDVCLISASAKYSTFRSQFLAVENSVEPRKSGAGCLKNRSGLSAPFARYYGGVRGQDEARAGTVMDGCALGRSDRLRAKAKKKATLAIIKDFAFADSCSRRDRSPANRSGRPSRTGELFSPPCWGGGDARLRHRERPPRVSVPDSRKGGEQTRKSSEVMKSFESQ